MYQLMKYILRENNDINLWLIFANQTEDDILLREELEEMLRKHTDRVHIWYTLDRAPEGESSFSCGLRVNRIHFLQAGSTRRVSSRPISSMDISRRRVMTQSCLCAAHLL